MIRDKKLSTLSDRMRAWPIRDDFPPFKTYNVIIGWATEVDALMTRLEEALQTAGRNTMNADEFRRLYCNYDQSRYPMLAEGIEEILRRLDEQEEFIHMPTEWNNDSKMCACGRLWPHG